MSKVKKNSFSKGLKGENIAHRYLSEHGYEIIHNRLRTPFGEIDFLVEDKQPTLVAVEIKLRKKLREAIESIQPRQLSRIRNALAFFVSENDMYRNHPLRIDCIIIDEEHRLKHYQNIQEGDSNAILSF